MDWIRARREAEFVGIGLSGAPLGRSPSGSLVTLLLADVWTTFVDLSWLIVPSDSDRAEQDAWHAQLEAGNMPRKGDAPRPIHADVFRSLDVRVSSGENEFQLLSWGSGSSFLWRGEANFIGDLDKTGGVTIAAAEGTDVASSVHFAVEDLIDPTR